MAQFLVPKNAGKCFVSRNWRAWTVTNRRNGQDRVFIPCKTKAEAEAICDRLNKGEHNGMINVPNHA